MALGWLWDSILKATAQPSPISTTPAFSPGPCSTREPALGRRRRKGLEVLYEQCSDQSTPIIPSSTSLGVRPSSSTMVWYSASVRATSRSFFAATAELTDVVADQRTGQEACLAEDLEPVADAPDQAPVGGEADDRVHHRAEAGDRTAAEVVAVGEATRQDDAVAVLQVLFLVPEVLELGSQHLRDHPAAVPVGPRPREDHDPELHSVLAAPACSRSATASTWKRTSSMTWLASSFRHISETWRRPSASSAAVTVISMNLPTLTSSTSSKPSRCSPARTVSPCGSFTTGFSITTTWALSFTTCPAPPPCRRGRGPSSACR